MRVPLTTAAVSPIFLPTNPASYARGVEVEVFARGTTEPAECFNAEEGGAVLTQPLLTDRSGRIEGRAGEMVWVERGAYDLLVNDQIVPWEATSGQVDVEFDAKFDGDTLKDEALPSSVVTDSKLPVLYPSDYGETEAGDDTKMLQAVIDAAKELGEAAIQFGPSYALKSNPRTDRRGNAILALPSDEDDASRIIFRADPRGTRIFSTVTGQSYSSSHGPPSMIGGPTSEQVGVETQNFSSCAFAMEGTFFLYPAFDTTVAALDLSRVDQLLKLEYVYANATDFATEYTEAPSHKHAFGVRLPEGLNGGMRVGRVEVRNFYAGLVANSAQTHAEFLIANYCVAALGITGNKQFSGNDGHSSNLTRLRTGESKYHVASWHPETGAISLPVSKPAQFVVGLWDIEDWGEEGKWYSTTNHLLDANNQLTGHAHYARVKGGTGKVSGRLTVSGGTGFGLTDITVPYPGAWIEFSAVGAKVEAAATLASLRVRLEQGGKVVRLRGGIVVKTGETLGSGELVCTLPEGCRPTAKEIVGVSSTSTSVPQKVKIEANGEIKVEGGSGLTAGQFLSLSGITFSVN